jgi:hypothetical protein
VLVPSWIASRNKKSVWTDLSQHSESAGVLSDYEELTSPGTSQFAGGAKVQAKNA